MKPAVDGLAAQLERLPPSVAAELGRRIERIRRRSAAGQPVDRMLQRLVEEVDQALAALAERAASVPPLVYPPELPVSQARERIAAALERHQVLVVCGDTGSGKTTQLPKICLEAGRGVRGMIGHTQPRRIAARAVAARIAEETGTEPGRQVGYKVRFTDRTRPETLVKLMTDGILLAETAHDPDLQAYDTLIIDEAHERSLNVDFLLGCLKRLLPHRPDLKLIITSATIDPGRFSRHFGDAPVIEVPGRAFPVRVEYRQGDGERQGEDADLTEQVVATARLLAARSLDDLGGGTHRDMLVFLPGERYIAEAQVALARDGPKGFDVLPLFGRLSGAQQDRIFHPGSTPRIVLATNVAETSLTVPRIRYVIDSGLARVSRYSPRSKIQRLPVEKISRAAAEQRRGRCGRLAPGLCVRLYAEEDFAERPEFTDSEILRTSLASVILRMEAQGLGAVEAFPFIEPPPMAAVRDGYRLLFELGAADAEERITPVGRQMAQLPVDPRIARMLLAAGETGALSEVLVIASALSVQDPRERPPDRQQAADEKHAGLADPRSDFLFFLNLWHTVSRVEADDGAGAVRRWCREHHIAWRRVREWQDVHRQLAEHARRLGLKTRRGAADYAAVHRALLPGLLGLVAQRDQRREYRGARDTRMTLFPGSALTVRPPPWLMAAEVLQTSRVFAMTCARVKPGWIEAAAAHLVRRDHADAHFNPDSGTVLCLERVTLWGLVLSANRRVPLARHDRAAAREMFAREALAGEQLLRPPGVLQRNWRLRRRLEDIEARIRRRDVVVGEPAIAALYLERLPEAVCDAASLRDWLAREPEAARRLELTESALRLRDTPEYTDERFPDHLEHGGNRLALRYRFDPGADDDGVTLELPHALLAGLDPARPGWLVPGLLAGRIDALLRVLPKADRRRLVPVPDTAARLAGEAPARPPPGKPVEAWLSERLQSQFGIRVDPLDWGRNLPDEWRMRVRLLDDNGQETAVSRDLESLRQDAGPVRSPVGDAAAAHERRGLKAWDFERLEERVSVRRSGLNLTLYPALVDRGTAVDLVLLDSPEAAEAATRGGVLRLADIRLHQQRRLLDRALRADRALVLNYRAVGSARDLAEDVTTAALQDAVLPPDAPVPRSRDAFEQAVQRGRGEVVPAGEALVGLLRDIVSLAAGIRRRLATQALPEHAREDLEEQLATLVHARTLRDTPPRWREQLPRYLRAMELRLDKLQHGHPRDVEYTALLREHRERVDTWQRRRHGTALPPALVDYLWQLQELRVSLFAQQLGTLGKVSARRLDEQWQRVGG